MPITRYRPFLPDVVWPRLGDVPGRFGRMFEDLIGPWPGIEEMGWTRPSMSSRSRTSCSSRPSCRA